MRSPLERVDLAIGSRFRDRTWVVPTVVTSSVAAAIGLALILLQDSAMPDGEDRWLAALFTALMALAWRFPLPLVDKTKFYLETAVTIAVILLFPSGIAMLIVGAGTVLGQLLSREPWDQAAFNSAQAMFQTAAGAGVLAIVAWDAGDQRLDTGIVLFVAILAGLVISVVNILAVASIVGLQTSTRITTVAARTVRGMGSAGVLMLLVQIVLGVIATEVAVAAPWAVALLAVPAAAIYGVLRHNGELRNRLETAMREREMSLAEVERMAGFGSWEWWLDRQEHHWSNELFHIVGLESMDGSVSALAFVQFAHPADRAMLEELLHDAIRRGSSFDVEHRIIRTDGAERVVHTHGDVLCESPGEPIRVIGTVHDISERKALEAQLLERMASSPLTNRELDVLSHLARGNSNKEIAARLSISEQTVKNHVASIMRKLHVNDRTQAVIAALRLGWIQLDDGPPDAQTV